MNGAMLSLTSMVTPAPVLSPPVALVTGLTAPQALMVDYLNVYWFDLDSRTLQGTFKTGGGVFTLATDAQPCSTWAAAHDLFNIYWADCATGDLRIRRVSKLGGPVATLATRPSGFAVLTLDALHVYWSEADGVKRVGKLGGGVTDVAPVTSSDRIVSGIQGNGSEVFYAESFSAAGLVPGPLSRANAGGGGQQQLLPDPTVADLSAEQRYDWSMFGFTAVTDLYWYDMQAGGPVRLDAGAAAPTLLAAGEAPGAENRMAVSSYYVYWSAASSPDGLGGIFRVPKGGGTPNPVVEMNRIIDIEIDWTHVYFATRQSASNADGGIYRALR